MIMADLPIKALLVVLLVLAILLTIPALTGVYVCRDARRRGMNAVLWTLVAVAAPALIGFIIYLLVRSDFSDLECPRCATPLDGAPRDAVPPRLRQDKALKRILAFVIVVPVLIIALAVAAVVLALGSCATGGMEEVTLDEYDQRQRSEAVRGAVHAWLDGADRADQAYLLEYDYASRLSGERCSYFLVYVPGSGQQELLANSYSFEFGSGLFGSSVVLWLERTEGCDTLFSLMVKNTRHVPSPRVALDGKLLRTVVQKVDYNPTLFYAMPDYAGAEPGDDVPLPERLSVVKYADSESAGAVEVTDRELMLRLLSAIDSGERVPAEAVSLPGFQLRDGFEVIVEYYISDAPVVNESMARHMVVMEDGVCYLSDSRVHSAGYGSSFRVMDGDFYGLLEGLFP